jgi:NADH-quinone oxidoreductase subunit N
MNSEFTTALLNVYPQLIPEMILVGMAALIFLAGTFAGRGHLWNVASLATVLLAMLALFATGRPGPSPAGAALFASPLIADNLAFLLKVIALGTGLILVLFSWHEVPERQTADHQACLLIVVAGLSIVGAANELVTLFLALEMISIPVYIMLYLPRHDDASQEAALKYFMLSIFSSGLLLFGFSYLYGLAGSTNIAVILQSLNQASANEVPGLAAVALILIVAGLGFRITAVPFHFYAPDVYQGAPTVMGALLAFVQKAAGFAALLRVLGFVLPATIAARGDRIGVALSDQVPILLWFLAVVTMFLGNVLGLMQDNVKRLLAYSSIAHAGYMLIALAAAPYLRHAGDRAGPDGIEALLYYLVAYGAMTVGAFAVLSYLSTQQRQVETMDDLAGLSASHPGIALFMTVFLFSLIGIPFTAGFTGKLLVFFGALGIPEADAHGQAAPAGLFRLLALIGVLNAAIGAWYYLRIIAVMYLRTSIRPLTNRLAAPGLATLWLCAILTIGLSFPPGSDWLMRAVRQATGLSGQQSANSGEANLQARR